MAKLAFNNPARYRQGQNGRYDEGAQITITNALWPLRIRLFLSAYSCAPALLRTQKRCRTLQCPQTGKVYALYNQRAEFSAFFKTSGECVAKECDPMAHRGLGSKH